MHNAGYEAAGLPFTYVAFAIEDTQQAILAMRYLGIRGLGVSMPHKIRVMQYLDALDETAQEIGAVNTVVNDQGRLTGYNTDWTGAVGALTRYLRESGVDAGALRTEYGEEEAESAEAEAT